MLRAITAAALVGLGAAPLHAQQQTGGREGFWFTIGAGAGSNRVDCDNCTDIERHWGGSAWIRAGGTLTSSTLIGGEIYFWQRSVEGGDAYIRGAQGVVQWYPFASEGFFVNGGLGLSRIRSEFVREGATVRATETGLSVLLGLGWDIPIAPNISLTPTLASIAVPTATIDTPAGPLNNVIGTLFEIGVGVTFR